MTIRTEKRNVGPLATRALVSSINVEKRTFDVMFSTGAKVLRSSWYDGQFYEELSMDPAHVRMGRLQSGTAPLLANHNSYDVAGTLGVIESARIENGKGLATVRMAAAGIDPEADKIFSKVVDKIITNVSVGYRTYKVEKTDGVDTKIPTLRAVDWEPSEISLVAMGAEQGAGIRSAEPQTNDVTITHRGSPHHTQENQMTEEEKRAAEAKALAETAKRSAEIEAEVAKRILTARERESGIKSACRTLGKEGDAFATKLLANDKLTLQEARNQVLDELATRSEDTAIQSQQGSGIERGEDDHDKWSRGAIAGQLSRSGMLPMLTAVAASVKDGKMKIPGVRSEFKAFDGDDSGGDFRNLTLLDLARESLERRGIKTRGLTTEKMVGLAFTHNTRDIGGGQTVSDFAVVLENVMYKTLLGAYAQASDTWRRFCGTDTVQDFRPSNRYRTGSFGVLDALNEAGEFKNKAIPDGLKFAITTETKGNVIALSRQAIINDDMGAITDTAHKFGRMAGLSIEKSVYDLLALNGGLGPTITVGGVTAPLFDAAAWGNVSTGAALSMVAIEADRVLMASQKDVSNNEYLDLRPNCLLIPIGLGGEANTINRSLYDPTAGSAFERPNIVGGLFKEVIDTPRITGTRRYLFTHSSQCSSIVVAFLNGAQSPFMDQQQGFRVDGVEWKVRLDYKAQAFDPKGGITNVGI